MHIWLPVPGECLASWSEAGAKTNVALFGTCLGKNKKKRPIIKIEALFSVAPLGFEPRLPKEGDFKSPAYADFAKGPAPWCGHQKRLRVEPITSASAPVTT